MLSLSSELLALSAAEQAAAVRDGEVRARELVEATLGAIDDLDEELGAFVTVVAERALEEAERVESGDHRPLAGVPVAIKDILALTEGIPVSFGTRAMRGWVPRQDSALVRRLRAAGAIVVGKTNLPELGILPVTEPEAFGPTCSPWDPERNAGGSSGGSAAAVGASVVSLAHGNDGGGSIRIPASCCGVVGLKPTRGRSSLAPAPDDPLGLVEEGPLSRTVADAARFLDVVAGACPGDSWSAAEPAEPFAEAARRPPRRLRIGFTSDTPRNGGVHPDCIAAMEDAAALLRSLGHEVEGAAPEWNDDLLSEHFVRAWIAGVKARVDNLGMVRGKPIELDELEPLTRQMCEHGARITAGDYIASVTYMRSAARRMARFWEGRDLLLTPTIAQPPPRNGALAPGPGEEPIDVLDKASDLVPFTAPWNVTGQPAISLPLWTSPDGLPIGVQLVGPIGGEGLLLSVGAQLEEARPWRERRPQITAA